MCFGGGGGGSAPATPAPIIQAPEAQDESVIEARDKEKMRRRAAANSTIITSPSGLSTPASTNVKSVLGR